MNLIKDLQYHFWDSNQNAVCTFDRNAKCYQNSKKGKEIYIFNCPCSNVFEVNVVKEKQNIEACSRKTVTFNIFGWNEREKNVHQHTHADAHTHTHTRRHTHTHTLLLTQNQSGLKHCINSGNQYRHCLTETARNKEG